MIEAKPDENNSIVTFLCSECKKNTIYIKFFNHVSNKEPYQGKDFSCTECSQGLNQIKESEKI